MSFRAQGDRGELRSNDRAPREALIALLRVAPAHLAAPRIERREMETPHLPP